MQPHAIAQCRFNRMRKRVTKIKNSAQAAFALVLAASSRAGASRFAETEQDPLWDAELGASLVAELEFYRSLFGGGPGASVADTPA